MAVSDTQVLRGRWNGASGCAAAVAACGRGTGTTGASL